MKKNGFTLIELLAVIVILAIISLIAVPIVLNIIRDARESSEERSVELYAKAVKNAIMKKKIEEPKAIITGSYASTTDGKNLTGPTTLNVEYDGKVYCKGIQIGNEENKNDYKLYLSGCTVSGSNNSYKYTDGIGAEKEGAATASVPSNPEEPFKYRLGIHFEIPYVSTSNPSTFVEQDESYRTTITVPEGYVLKYILVMMGSEDVTSEVYKDGEIFIDKVTDPISISGEAEPKKQNIEPEGVETVYFDVKKGEFCTKENYESSYVEYYNDYLNSLFEYNGIDKIGSICKYGRKETAWGHTDNAFICTQIEVTNANSCLKFYKIKEDEIAQTLILDHAIAYDVPRGDGGYLYGFGLEEGAVLNVLKTKTSSWNGVIEPSNVTETHKYFNITAYEEDQKANELKDDIEYQEVITNTINYSGYKARLITGEEIDYIINNGMTSIFKYAPTSKTGQVRTIWTSAIDSYEYYIAGGCTSYTQVHSSQIAINEKGEKIHSMSSGDCSWGPSSTGDFDVRPVIKVYK